MVDFVEVKSCLSHSASKSLQPYPQKKVLAILAIMFSNFKQQETHVNRGICRNILIDMEINGKICSSMFCFHMKLWILSSVRVSFNEWWEIECLKLISFMFAEITNVDTCFVNHRLWLLGCFLMKLQQMQYLYDEPRILQTFGNLRSRMTGSRNIQFYQTLVWSKIISRLVPNFWKKWSHFEFCTFDLPRTQRQTFQPASPTDFMETGLNLNVPRHYVLQVQENQHWKSNMETTTLIQSEVSKNLKCLLCSFHAARPQQRWTTGYCSMAQISGVQLNSLLWCCIFRFKKIGTFGTFLCEVEYYECDICQRTCSRKNLGGFGLELQRTRNPNLIVSTMFCFALGPIERCTTITTLTLRKRSLPIYRSMGQVLHSILRT